MDNLTIRQLEDNLIEILNKSGAQIEVKRLIVADVYNQILKESNNAVAQEMKASLNAQNAIAEREYQDEQSVQPN